MRIRAVKCAVFAVMSAGIIMAAGCGDAAFGRTSSGPKSVDDVLSEGMAEADAAGSADTAGDDQAVASDTGDTTANDAGDASASDSVADTPVLGVAGNVPADTFDADDLNAAASATEGIDVDLTILSPTMVYSEVYNMMTSPDDFMGKTIKMNGLFSVYHDEATDKYYYACIIQDATACCAQGIEFELKGEHKYPDDYPEEDCEVTVTGVFDTYTEGEYKYCTLRNAVMN